MTQKIVGNARRLLLYLKQEMIWGQVPLSLSFCIKKIPNLNNTQVALGREMFLALHSPTEASRDLHRGSYAWMGGGSTAQ